jgi:hypothetical protein
LGDTLVDHAAFLFSVEMGRPRWNLGRFVLTVGPLNRKHGAMADLDRTEVTFEQAEGAEPLPAQLKPRELTPALRATLWNALYQQLGASTRHIEMGPTVLVDPWLAILRDKHVFRDHQPADEFSNRPAGHIAALKALIMSGDYLAVFGTLQWFLRHQKCPRHFPPQIAQALQACRAGYRLTDNGRTLFPITSEEEAATAQRAFEALNAGRYAGARQHLTAGAERLTAGDSAGAVRESMQAVESVARAITGKSSFAEALKVIDGRWKIHGALKVGFGRLYDYTSAEQGIRHPLIDDPNAQVDETDALFMFGACAAFITYLINKAAFHPSRTT